MICTTSEDCPAGGADARAASVCVDSSCTECGADADCTAELPACVEVSSPGLALTRTCVECSSNAHCPTDKPHCVGAGGIGGECRTCASNADCETGICGASGCVAACTDDSECGNPTTRCTNQRCETIVCTDSSVCPVNAECRDGVCLRTACEFDADCADGICVNAACYETLGRCFTQTYAP
jgi:hypothetical protein